MSRLGSWLRGSTTSRTSTNPSPSGSQLDLRAREVANLEDAMGNAALIMNDDIDGAEENLRKGDSAFHLLGLAVCVFMRSILGTEKQIMLDASNRINDTETSAWNEMKKAQKEASSSGGSSDSIYPPGSEYALVLAEAQLMAAIVGVLHESLTEAIKGFYKLRKAYLALEGIMAAESAYLRRSGLQPNESREDMSQPLSEHRMPGGFDDNDDLEFVDADEAHPGVQTPLEYEGHLAKDSDIDKKMGELSLDDKGENRGEDQAAKVPTGDVKERGSASVPQRGFDSGPDAELFSDPVDFFIHSGANMCFGVLSLMISLVPPAFSRLLSIIGFKGDRERGIKMLWQSSRFDNINGAVAALMLLAYYHGLLGFADILPNEEDVNNGAVSGYPRARCAALLATMRSRYPDSGLWKLEEARIKANGRDLHGAIDILKKNSASKMLQVTALNSFELSLNSMFVQDYPEMRDNFLRCIELNDWSPALYYYIAGCAEVESYRNAYHAEKKDESQIELHKRKAEELLRKAPTVAGRKRFMARPLPFEEFLTRKLSKWEERAKAFGLDLVDATGASPAQEMVYLWNGVKKMAPPELEKAYGSLSWDRLTAPEEAANKISSEADERAVCDVCRASIQRALGNLDGARGILEEVLKTDKSTIKGVHKDDYALPSAHYEMAVLAWAELEKPKQKAEEEMAGKKLAECQSWLDKVAKWETYVLDARIGMRVQTGMDTIRWYKREHDWASG